MLNIEGRTAEKTTACVGLQVVLFIVVHGNFMLDAPSVCPAWIHPSPAVPTAASVCLSAQADRRTLALRELGI